MKWQTLFVVQISVRMRHCMCLWSTQQKYAVVQLVAMQEDLCLRFIPQTLIADIVSFYTSGGREMDVDTAGSVLGLFAQSRSCLYVPLNMQSVNKFWCGRIGHFPTGTSTSASILEWITSAIQKHPSCGRVVENGFAALCCTQPPGSPGQQLFPISGQAFVTSSVCLIEKRLQSISRLMNANMSNALFVAHACRALANGMRMWLMRTAFHGM
jgi:hypothetical protein